jgi:hypothetical protein
MEVTTAGVDTASPQRALGDGRALLAVFLKPQSPMTLEADGRVPEHSRCVNLLGVPHALPLDLDCVPADLFIMDSPEGTKDALLAGTVRSVHLHANPLR